MIYLITENLQLFDNEDYCLITKENAYSLLNQAQEIEVDTETTGLDPHTCKLLTQQFGIGEHQFVIDNKTIDPCYYKNILIDRDRNFIFQNAKFDLKFFLKLGIDIQNIYDTFLAECVLTTGLFKPGLGLDKLAEKYCNVKLDKSIRGNIHREGLTNRVVKYCADDVTWLKKIKEKQLIEITKYNLNNVLDLENKVTEVFAKMEFNGVHLNKEKWLDVAKTTEAETLRLEGILDNILLNEPKLKKFQPRYTQVNLFDYEERKVNINWASPQQKLDIIKTLGFDTKTVGDRFMQVNKNKHPLVKELIGYNKYNKLASSFGKGFLKYINKNTGKLHYNVWQVLKTGRISVSDPNLSQIPSKGELGKEIRSCFIPKEGNVIVGGDYSGMELRIIAEFSQDPLWVNSFKEGKDLHSVLCAATFDIPITDVKLPFPGKPDIAYRDIQKTINFGLAYGMSKFKLADTMQISVEEADAIIKKFFKVVPRVEKFLTMLGELSKHRGFIRTPQPYGRIRWFEGYEDKDDFVNLGKIERAGKNTPIQGCNGDILKLALIKVQTFIDEHNLPIQILLSVYDEIQTECPLKLSEEWKLNLDRLMIEAAKHVIKETPVIVDCKISKYWQK